MQQANFEYCHLLDPQLVQHILGTNGVYGYYLGCIHTVHTNGNVWNFFQSLFLSIIIIFLNYVGWCSNDTLPL